VTLVNQLLIYTVIFVIGVVLFALLAQLGIALGLATDTARLLAFGGLAAYSLAIVVWTRRR
jgi:small basic protein